MRIYTPFRRQRGRGNFWRMIAVLVLSTGLAQTALTTTPDGVVAQPAPTLNWARLANTGPSAQSSSSMAYDPISERVILFGGTSWSTQTWAWDGSTWTMLSPATSPPARRSASMAYDPVSGQIILYGGHSPGTGGSLGDALGDTWTWDGTTWTMLSPGTQPIACDSTGQLCDEGRESASMAYDPVTDRLILFGGFNGRCAGSRCIGLLNDTWAWDGATWQELSPSTSPMPRVRAGFAYNPSTSQVILFGGTGEECPLGCPTTSLNDTWTWDGSDWVELSPATSPPTRSQHAMAYDPATGGLLVYGGFGGIFGTVLGDTWLWDGSNWNELSPTVRPFPRGNVAMAYNPDSSQLIFYGGMTTTFGGDVFRDTWSWGDDDGQVMTVTMTFPLPPPDLPGQEFSLWFDAEDVPVIGTITATDPSGITDIFCDAATVSNVSGYGTPFAIGTLSKSGPDGTTRVTCFATNGAGVTASPSGSHSSVYISIDANAPTISDTGFVSGTPGENGWYISPVTHGFSAVDPGSDLRYCQHHVGGDPIEYVLEADSGDQQGSAVTISSGECRDNAFNTNPGIDSAPYMIDFTAPYDVALTSGALTDGATYYAGFVPDGPTSCTAQDDVSGFDRCDVSGYGTTPGDHTVTATAYDSAGNYATTTLSYTVEDWSVELCASYYTGAVNMARSGGACPAGTLMLELSPAPAVTLCINPYTGRINWAPGGTCSGNSWPHVIPDDGPLHYCQSLWTGQMRFAPPGHCSAAERPGSIPG